MAGLSFGDLAQSYLTRSRLGHLKSETVRLAQELGFGRTSDVARAVAGDTSRLGAITHRRELLDAFTRAGHEIETRTRVRESALDAIKANLEMVRDTTMPLLQDASRAQILRAAETARQGFSAAMERLNTDHAGRSVFSGIAVAGPALVPPADVLSELDRLLGTISDPEVIALTITEWFQNPAGFTAFAYLGGAAGADLKISDDGSHVAEITAVDSDIRDALSGLAVAAFLDRATLSDAGPDRITLITRATETLQFGAGSLTELLANIGSARQLIDQSLSRNEAELLSLGMLETTLIGVDPAQAATELEATRANLETAYAVTARLSRLSLAEYMR